MKITNPIGPTRFISYVWASSPKKLDSQNIIRNSDVEMPYIKILDLSCCSFSLKYLKREIDIIDKIIKGQERIENMENKIKPGAKTC